MIRIALFGEPGSGKTTIARKVSMETGFPVVEASEKIIFPIASLHKYPDEEKLLSLLKKNSKKKFYKISREYAKKMFKEIEKKYSSDFIAKALHHIYVDNNTNKSRYKGIIFSGLRGIGNARYCRLHNDVVIYMKSSKESLIRRLSVDRDYDRKQAILELKREKTLYKTAEIEKIADIIIDSSKNNIRKTVANIISEIRNWNRTCRRCVNTSKNPSITFDRNGYCNICSAYMKNFDRKHLKKELGFLKSWKKSEKPHGKGKYDVMVGISGGKDSTATLHTVKQIGFHPLAFTFNTGYLPETTIPRSRSLAKYLDIDFELIDIRKYIRKIDVESYKKTVQLYESPFTLETKNLFKKYYSIGRKHYSVKCKHSLIFVRSCQLCRRMVVRAYYGEARKRNISAIILGMNEWTNLSAAQRGKNYKVSGIRRLQPYKNQPPVYVFHLPFLLQRNSQDTKRTLQRLKWKPPKGEDFIESNSNSCLYARSTERMAKRLLEFHPDTTRLAREVTVGFITKRQALKALGKIHPYRYTPRQVLERAGIL